MVAVVSGRLPQVLTLNPATLTLVSEEEVAEEAVAQSSPVLTSCLHLWVLVPLEEVAGLRLSCDLRLEGEVPSPLDLMRVLPVVSHWECALEGLVRVQV